ncbi:MAG TPA: lamin tail domain-containing protein, partial [Candidatus Poseidoniaceae archaeon]|nr:lamin tail domain-containing protein [Candidatus Poseidoniaceae archaeon]
MCAAGDIIITEAHADGAPEDYIELKNTGSQACSLEGWQLYDQGKADDGVGDLTFG